jgi:hypothetical protein
MDIVYVVRDGDENEELRFSLRSLVNLPHDQVWIVGHKPSWVTGVEHLPTFQAGTKYENSTQNLLAACDHPDVADEFALMNDDIYVVKPLKAVPVFHRGPVAELVAYYRRKQGPYLEGMQATAGLLAGWGFSDPLSYELHMPLPVVKAAMADVLRRGIGHTPVLHKRTLYGNVMGIGGELTQDCKIRRPLDASQAITGPFLSTKDSTFRYARRRLERMFPFPSPYEVDAR